MKLFEGIGQKHPKTLVPRGFVAGFGQQHVELQVRHRIRRHQNLETIQPWNQMVFDVITSDSLLPLEPLVNMHRVRSLQLMPVAQST